MTDTPSRAMTTLHTTHLLRLFDLHLDRQSWRVMVVHQRKALESEQSVPLLPTTSTDNASTESSEELKKIHRPLPACKITLSQSGLLLFGILTYIVFHKSLGFSFPFPPSPEKPLPKFVKEGIEQCKIISRPSPSFTPYDGGRKESDRFVKGTKGVWLKNGTIWTGNKDGEEILRGYDVLLQGGVVRKVGKGEDWSDLVKGVEEVDLHGAWVTPGKSGVGTGEYGEGES